jgi:hypothetical protein
MAIVSQWRPRAISASLLITMALLGAGCGEGVSRDEVARITSPNGKLDAVLTEINGGATTSFGYDVTVAVHGQKRGERVANLYDATRNAQAYGVNLRWTDDHTLRVEYLEATYVRGVINSLNVNGQHIEVELLSGIDDPNAPAGGMWYNQHHRPT